MPPTLNLAIGDLSIGIDWEGPRPNRDLPPAFRPFIRPGKPDIRLRVHPAVLTAPCGEKVFECAPIWTLYRRHQQSIIKIFDRLAVPGMTLSFPAEPEAADLYPADEVGSAADPFLGPVLELLTIKNLARGKGVILHACGIERDGKGYLFAGESGAGKSTLARLWNRQKGVAVLSDDRTIVRQKNGRHWIYGTPWHGEAEFGAPHGVKLEKIFFLRHASRNATRHVTRVSAVTRLLTYSFAPYWDAAGMEFAMEFFSDLAAAVSCQVLCFTPDESVVEYILR
jgi:hypothetical protein